MGIYNDLIFTEAVAQVEALTTSTSSDEIATRLEHIAGSQDLAHTCLMLLVMKARGIDTSDRTGVEMANIKPTIADLILPGR